MGDQTSAPQRLPPTSLRQKLAEDRAEFRDDTRAEATADKVMGLVIAYILIGVISFALFTNTGPDAASICSDVESAPGAGDGNFTQEDCDGATNFRAGFWVVMGLVTVVFIILAVVIARNEVQGRRR